MLKVFVLKEIAAFKKLHVGREFFHPMLYVSKFSDLLECVTSFSQEMYDEFFENCYGFKICCLIPPHWYYVCQVPLIAALMNGIVTKNIPLSTTHHLPQHVTRREISI